MTKLRQTAQSKLQPTASRRRPLVAALALSPLLASVAAFADPVTHVVTTCNDALFLPVCNGSDDGTLRQAFACAQDGDNIDLTQLQCSTITLAAPLTSGPVGLSLTGPGDGLLTISAGNQFRALVHNGRPGDKLSISGLIIRNGSYDNPYDYLGGGGCIFSSGNIDLLGSEVTACYTSAANTLATGGAIFAKGTVTLLASSVSGSTATGFANTKYASARGGGVYADTVNVYASVVSGNTAASPTETTYGGGVYAKHVVVKYSTIAGNSATRRAGVGAGQSLVLTSSTISGNSASEFDGGAHLAVGEAQVYNSTIAFNTAGAAGSTGGISGGALHLESSIVARNTAGGAPSDVGTVADGIRGTHNLIMASNVAAPLDTLVADPQLGPLQDNGGLTATHALGANSPAIDRGSNPLNADWDQRFDLRQVGAAPDIGAFELDRLFSGTFEFGASDLER